LFEKLYNSSSLDGVKTMINKQYRMNPKIADFISKEFYNGEYYSGIKEEDRIIDIAGKNKPIYFYDTANLPEEERFETVSNTGFCNEIEAELCSNLLVELITAIESGKYTIRKNATLKPWDKVEQEFKYDIGVITGYGKQVELIKEKTFNKIKEAMQGKDPEAIMKRFMISTVDSFQGRDNEIILFSMTRSNEKGTIGFLRDVRRLNVAMTRAKSMLIMFGDSTTLTKSYAAAEHNKDKKAAHYYKQLVKYCKDNDFYFNV